jgi:hypothetical protein
MCHIPTNAQFPIRGIAYQWYAIAMVACHARHVKRLLAIDLSTRSYLMKLIDDSLLFHLTTFMHSDHWFI